MQVNYKPETENLQAHEIRAQYAELDFDCIPLRSGSKIALLKGWPTLAPAQQWRKAPSDANFGLRAGNGKAFIDADDKNQPGTFANITNWLAGLGYEPGTYPVIQTASGVGRQVYVNFTGQILKSAPRLDPRIGAGEFRAGVGAYVAAPPSVVDGRQYQIIDGDLLRLPTLDERDIQTLIRESAPQTETPVMPRMSRRALALSSGKGGERYRSASEAEAALTLALINGGFDYAGIKAVFDKFPAFGKYAGLKTTKGPNEAERWLYLTYQNALAHSRNESQERQTIRRAKEAATAASWPRVNDKLILLAHLELAFRAGTSRGYAAAVRDLALEAGVGGMTASRTTHRLIKAGLVAIEEAGTIQYYAHRYTLQVDKLVHSLKNQDVRECIKMSTLPVDEPRVVADNGLLVELDRLRNHDAFRNGRGRLGRRAGEVYELLFTEPMTAGELATRTGASIKTIRRSLKKLANLRDYKTGEIIEMVTCGEGGRWNSRTVDLELVEAIMGTRGQRQRQEAGYIKERRARARELEIGALKERAE